MITFSYASKAKSTIPVFLPLFTEHAIAKKRETLQGLTRAQKRAVRLALTTENIPENGILPVFSGDAPVFVFFVGKKETITKREAREAGEKAAPLAKKYKIDTFQGACGSFKKELCQAFCEGIIFGSYEFTEYKGTRSKEDLKKTRLKKVIFLKEKNKEEEKYIAAAHTGISLTKDIINTPPTEANPTYMAKIAQEIAKENEKVSVKIFGEKELAKMNCGGILGVGRGSRHESRLIVLEYKGGKTSEKPIALVGKGVTFDTGGNNIKGRHMRWMKQDLGGSASVLGAFVALVHLGVKKNITAIIPTVENMVDKDSYFPDDILTMYNGITVEIHNTDAEGRLILADALAYADDKIKPQAMVDLATLTGACAYAVGNDFTAGLANNDKLFTALEKASKTTDEPLWRLPLHARYREKYLKSATADIVNCGDGARAGTIEGGLFLQEFVKKDTPWCHLDIASVAFDEGKGLATGRDVRMLIEFVKKYEK